MKPCKGSNGGMADPSFPPCFAGASLKPALEKKQAHGPQGFSPVLRGGLIEAGLGDAGLPNRPHVFPRASRGPH